MIAHPGDGRAAVVLLEVGVVLAGGEMRGGVRDVGGEPAGMARRAAVPRSPCHKATGAWMEARSKPPRQERCGS